MSKDGKPDFKDHFSSGSADYAAHRPSYPMELVDALASVSPGLSRALDCGCGTGQLSVLLAERFDEVVATDASGMQIEKARAHPKVRYCTALAESTGLAAASVDLITVAQAAHWLGLEKFYAEVRRVGRPKAVIALIAYGVLRVEGELDAHMQRFYTETIGSYWPPERRHVKEGYRNLPFPFAKIALPQFAIEVQWSLQDLVGYLNTWSAVRAAEKALGSNPVEPFADMLRQRWGDAQSRRRIRWPLSVHAGYVSD